MKTTIVVLVVLVLGVVGWKAIQTKPDASVPQAVVNNNIADTTVGTTTENTITPVNTTPSTSATKTVDNANVKVTFKGFGPGKVHEGSFGKLTSELAFTEGNLAGMITVDVGSLTTDSEKLITHLNSADFFDTKKFPTATFKITSWKNGNVTGAMTVHGVTKNISFPVKILESYPEQYVATFTLNMKEFGINQKFANEMIELNVTVPVK